MEVITLNCRHERKIADKKDAGYEILQHAIQKYFG